MESTNDLVTKNFEAYPDVAADILNVLLYEGKNEIKEENLLASPTETLYQGEKKLRNQLECYPAFYLVLNHPTFNQIKKKHGINYSDKFYIRLLYAVSFVLSY